MSFQPSSTTDAQRQAHRVPYSSRGQSYSDTATSGNAAQQAQDMPMQDGFLPQNTSMAATTEAPSHLDRLQQPYMSPEQVQELQEVYLREHQKQQVIIQQQQRHLAQLQQSRMEQAHYNGGPNAAPFLKNFSLLAEAARRAQVDVLAREMEGVGI